jgi:hypothetical protein
LVRDIELLDQTKELLIQNKIYSVGDICTHSSWFFRKISGFGRKKMDDLSQYLYKNHIDFGRYHYFAGDRFNKGTNVSALEKKTKHANTILSKQVFYAKIKAVGIKNDSDIRKFTKNTYINIGLGKIMMRHLERYMKEKDLKFGNKHVRYPETINDKP